MCICYYSMQLHIQPRMEIVLPVLLQLSPEVCVRYVVAACDTPLQQSSCAPDWRPERHLCETRPGCCRSSWGPLHCRSAPYLCNREIGKRFSQDTKWNTERRQIGGGERERGRKKVLEITARDIACCRETNKITCSSSAAFWSDRVVKSCFILRKSHGQEIFLAERSYSGGGRFVGTGNNCDVLQRILI